MTYLKSALIASALTAVASSAAFAGGDTQYKTDVKMMDKNALQTSTSMQSQAQTTTLTKANDTIGEVLQADGQPDTQSDYELLTHDGDMLTKREALMMDSDGRIANNAIVVPSSSGAITTVNCPIGTTAKPDMTCHVTGNFDLERMDNLLKQENKADAKVMGVVAYESDIDYNANDYSNYKGTLRPDSVVVNNIE